MTEIVIGSKQIVLILFKSHGNYKENTYRRYKKENEKGIKTCQDKHNTIFKKPTVSLFLWVITLNVNKLNSPIKRQSLDGLF